MHVYSLCLWNISNYTDRVLTIIAFFDGIVTRFSYYESYYEFLDRNRRKWSGPDLCVRIMYILKIVLMNGIHDTVSKRSSFMRCPWLFRAFVKAGIFSNGSLWLSLFQKHTAVFQFFLSPIQTG